MPKSGQAAARLLVNLEALAHNYAVLRRLCGSEVAAVVKADAYGLGLQPVAQALADTGCKTFFTAFTHEAIALRSQLPKALIYVFSPFPATESQALIKYELKPCLYDRAGVEAFGAAARRASIRPTAALHFETGINRLGLAASEIEQIKRLPALTRFDIDLVMSHLACADVPDHPLNRVQLERFRDIRAAFGDARASLANSGGTLLGSDYHFDLVRPGIALYGHDPHYRLGSPRVRTVATLQAPLGQIKRVSAGESIGYGATVKAHETMTVGVVLAGYADGIPRCLTEVGTTYCVAINGQRAPLTGRASMDLVTADLSKLSLTGIEPGVAVEIFGTQIPIEEAAEKAATIPYELLTRVGSRVERVYVRPVQ